MKNYKIVFVLGLILSFTSCKQSFSDKEKELLKETGVKILKDMEKEPSKKKEKKLKNSFSKPLCDLLTQNDIKAVFPDATNFEYKRTKEKTPNCKISFLSFNKILNMKIAVAITIEGRKVFHRQSDQEYIASLNMGNKNWMVIEGLGNEAHFFPSETAPMIVVMYKDQRFVLHLSDMSETNKEKILKIARSIV